MDLQKKIYEIPKLEQQGRYTVITGSNPNSATFQFDFMEIPNDFMDTED
jgi:hypothetical protein